MVYPGAGSLPLSLSSKGIFFPRDGIRFFFLQEREEESAIYRAARAIRINIFERERAAESESRSLCPG